ncbi:MAG: BMP family ABC transporter substrate-binding protein [Treponema sp.]|jgi:simple sugar transport system substrate-binding protein|nr:BMP family ABC transporter substrate-binding protein [Treponema sp.]
MKRITVFFLLCLFLVSACKGKYPARQPEQDNAISVLVFITGVAAGSPPYEMLAAGAREFADENNSTRNTIDKTTITVKIYEAGFNQAEWEEQLRSMVADGEYDLVLGSNPALPEICANVGALFPNQKFIIVDAALGGNPQISTYLYNQYEQALFLGYLAGLVSTSAMPHANASKRIGFIAAQEYPLLSRHIVPGFLDGARRVDTDIELDFRVIGNWYDASKAAELAAAMINAGADVFSSIAGGAAQGLVRAIKERNAYAVSFNASEYDQAPGLIIGCGIMQQKKLVKEILADVLAGRIQYGNTRTVGVKEGYLDFIFDDPGYRDYLPVELQNQFNAFMGDLRAGRINYTVPPL